jgi:signal transduction histidine kinase
MGTSGSLKYFIAYNLLTTFVCILGGIHIYYKADLPFKVSQSNDNLIILEDYGKTRGLLSGDKLVAVDGINVQDRDEYEFILDGKLPGENIEISYIRSEFKNNTQVTLTHYYSLFYLIIVSFTSLLFIITSSFVLVKSRLNNVSIVFNFSSTAIAIWIMTTSANYIVPNHWIGVSTRIILHFVYTLGSVLFIHFTLIFPTDRTRQRKKLLIALYAAAIVIPNVINKIFLDAINQQTVELIRLYTNLYNSLRIFAIVCIMIAISIFFNSFVSAKTDEERKKLKWLLYGFLIGPCSFVFLWLLPQLLFSQSVFPEEVIMILLTIIPLTFSIAIVKYRIMDIDYIINRSVVYGIVISLLTILYIFLITTIISIFKISDSPPLSAVFAVLIALIFEPVKVSVQNFVNKKFFRVRFNFREEVNRFIYTIKEFTDVSHLSRFLVEEIDRLIPVDKIGFCELSSNNKIYLRCHRNFDQIANKTLSLKYETLLLNIFEVAAVKAKIENDLDISSLYQNTLIRWNISLVIPIKSVKNDLYGFLILGNKKSGARYSAEDVDLLKDIGVSAAAVIERIKLQEELVKEKLIAEKLEELNQQKLMFVSRVSHDLKTPLTSIKMFAEMLKNDDDKLPGQSLKHIEIIEGESDRLTRLINNVLDFAKIERGALENVFEKIHLNEVIAKAVEVMQYPIKMKNFVLKVQLNEFDDLIMGDENAICESLENLISNAIRYSPKNKDIELKTFSSGNYSCVSVSDKGIGIHQDDINEIFTSFYRTQNSIKNKIEGTGLGLPIVKQIMDAHKGIIKVISEPGKGSTFTLCFPNSPNDNQEG